MKKFSLEELMEIKVTSVSRGLQKLTVVASGNQVDPKSRFLFQSIRDLPAGFGLAIDRRYIRHLKQTAYNPSIHSYFTVNARIGWQHKAFEIALWDKTYGREITRNSLNYQLQGAYAAGLHADFR